MQYFLAKYSEEDKIFAPRTTYLTSPFLKINEKNRTSYEYTFSILWSSVQLANSACHRLKYVLPNSSRKHLSTCASFSMASAWHRFQKCHKTKQLNMESKQSSHWLSQTQQQLTVLLCRVTLIPANLASWFLILSLLHPNLGTSLGAFLECLMVENFR